MIVLAMSVKYEELSDERLMEAYQEGHYEAFEELYRRYSKRIYGFISKKNTRTENIDELFQTVFQKLHTNRFRYDSKYPFSAWIFTICRNAIIDFYRKQGRRKEVTTKDYEDLLSKTAPETAPESPPLAELDKLPTAQQEAIELRYYQDLPFEEIAKRLKTSPANVRQLISRGIRRLKGLMEKS